MELVKRANHASRVARPYTTLAPIVCRQECPHSEARVSAPRISDRDQRRSPQNRAQSRVSAGRPYAAIVLSNPLEESVPAGQVVVHGVEGEMDEHCFAFDVIKRDKSPDPAVR